MKRLPLVINIRGNSGSGKTHLTREFMRLGKFEEVSWDSESFKAHDLCGTIGKQKWAVLGKYSNVCGGCDTIKTQDEVVRRVACHLANGRNVWLEGLIMSTIYGTVGAYSEQWKDRWVFCYLDTPRELCMTRITERRLAAQNFKPFNADNTMRRFATIERNQQIVRDHGRRVVVLDHRKALKQLMPIIQTEGLQ